MPVIAAQAAARAAGNGKLSGAHLGVVLLVIAGGAALLWAGLRNSPGSLKVPASTTESSPAFTPPPQHPVATVDQHIGGVMWLPHRYPHVCGHEISALINGGHATLRLPSSRDAAWIVRPPSEATL